MFSVTNKNDFDFSAKFDGKNFHFPAGQARICPDDAVVHIFGLGTKDKAAIISRHGWAKPNEPMDVGIAKLKQFTFEEIKPQFAYPMATESYGPAPVVSGSDGDKGTDGPELPSAKRTGMDTLSQAAALASAHRRTQQPA